MLLRATVLEVLESVAMAPQSMADHPSQASAQVSREDGVEYILVQAVLVRLFKAIDLLLRLMAHVLVYRALPIVRLQYSHAVVVMTAPPAALAHRVATLVVATVEVAAIQVQAVATQVAAVVMGDVASDIDRIIDNIKSKLQ